MGNGRNPLPPTLSLSSTLLPWSHTSKLQVWIISSSHQNQMYVWKLIGHRFSTANMKPLSNMYINFVLYAYVCITGFSKIKCTYGHSLEISLCMYIFIGHWKANVKPLSNMYINFHSLFWYVCICLYHWIFQNQNVYMDTHWTYILNS